MDMPGLLRRRIDANSAIARSILIKLPRDFVSIALDVDDGAVFESRQENLFVSLRRLWVDAGLKIPERPTVWRNRTWTVEEPIQISSGSNRVAIVREDWVVFHQRKGCEHRRAMFTF